MKNNSSSELGRGKSWLGRCLTFASAAAMGAILLGVRWAVRGNADPFNVGWPLYLVTGSFVLTLFAAVFNGRPFAAALGVFVGLVAYLLFDGNAEYPVASLIALALYGLLPALAGAACFVLVRRIAPAIRARGRQ